MEAADYFVGLYGSVSSLTTHTADDIKSWCTIWLAHWVDKTNYSCAVGCAGDTPDGLAPVIGDEALCDLIHTFTLSAKNGNTWHFGYKAHIGVDRESGLVHHVDTTAANDHDVTAVSRLMHGEEDTLHGDSGYIGAQKRPDAITRNKKGKKIKYLICRKPSAIQKLSKSGQYAAKKAEHKKSSVRCKVEHVFAVVKRLFGYRKTRYRGLRKQTAKNYIMFTLANLYLADRKTLSV